MAHANRCSCQLSKCITKLQPFSTVKSVSGGSGHEDTTVFPHLYFHLGIIIFRVYLSRFVIRLWLFFCWGLADDRMSKLDAVLQQRPNFLCALKRQAFRFRKLCITDNARRRCVVCPEQRRVGRLWFILR